MQLKKLHGSVCRLRSFRLIVLVLLLLVQVPLIGAAAGRIRTCSLDLDCNEGKGGESVCEKGKCTNPFEGGCLSAMTRRDGHDNQKESFLNGNDFLNGRVCNSDDEAMGTTDNCLHPDNEYPEVRLSPGAWESATVLGWIIQIVLSEVFGVPTTIETGNGERESMSSFYDRESRFVLPNSQKSYPYEQLVEADRVNGDCSNTEEPCAHVMTEVWTAGKFGAFPYQENGTILQSESSGYSARIGYYVPLHTVERDGSFASYYGFQGEENKQKVADTFKTPTNWTDYCNLVSKSNCTIDDGIAKHYPKTIEEGSSYFVEDAYKGHFRTTFQNNCTENPNCTGSAVVYKCDASVYFDNQFYWNDIRLTPDGTLRAGAYKYSHMLQIYKAANATKSDVFMYYYEPDAFFEKFATSRAMKMKRVDFPNPTMDCNAYRATQSAEERCSEDIEVRRGSAIGSCDYAYESVPKLFSRGLETATISTEEFTRSPALEYMKGFEVPQHTMSEIFRKWEDFRAHDNNGKVMVDIEREVLCQWVYDHLDFIILRNKPKGYPRKLEYADYDTLSRIGFAIGSVTLFVAAMTAALIYKFRKHREIRYAKVKVLYFVTLGHAFIAAAGITLATELEDFRCTLIQYFIRLGYSFALMPIFIKVSAINKLTRASMRFRRVRINDHYFGNVLFLTVFIVLLFLVAWTITDPPVQDKDYRLETDDDDDEFFRLHIGCASNSNAWEMAAFGLEFLVLACATVLTYQSREVIQELNESHWLAFMVYSLFLFMIMRLMVTALMFADIIPSALALKIISLLLSLDSLVALCIYFCPKFANAIKNNASTSGSSNDQSRHRSRNSISSIESRNSNQINRRISVSNNLGQGQASNNRPNPRSKPRANPRSYARKISGVNVPRTLSGRIPKMISKTPGGSQHSAARSLEGTVTSNKLRRSSSGSHNIDSCIPRKNAEMNKLPPIKKESEVSQECESFPGVDSVNMSRRSSGNSIASFSGSRHSYKKEVSFSDLLPTAEDDLNPSPVKEESTTSQSDVPPVEGNVVDASQAGEAADEENEKMDENVTEN